MVLIFHFSFYVQLGYDVFRARSIHYGLAGHLASDLEIHFVNQERRSLFFDSLSASQNQSNGTMLVKFRVGSNVNYSINFCQQRGSTSYLAPRVFCEVVSAFLWPKKLRDRQCDEGNGVEQCTYRYD